MKKFHFSLDRLLRYKEQVFDVERGILADMNLRLHHLQGELEELRVEIRRSADELNGKYATGITATEILRHKIYLNALDDSIRAKIREIELQQEAIDRQTDKIREAKIEISTMEKLREKKLEEYNYLVAKSEEQFIEEFVSNQKAMAAEAASA